MQQQVNCIHSTAFGHSFWYSDCLRYQSNWGKTGFLGLLGNWQGSSSDVPPSWHGKLQTFNMSNDILYLLCRAESSDVFVGWHVIVAHMYLRPCQLLALCLVLIPNSGYQILSRCPKLARKNVDLLFYFCSDWQARPKDDKMLSRGLGRQIPALHERRRLWDLLLKVWPQWGLFLSFSFFFKCWPHDHMLLQVWPQWRDFFSLSIFDHMTTCFSKFDHSEITFLLYQCWPHDHMLFQVWQNKS